MEKNKSILIFGAGKIGRSFIGQLFGVSGYDVIFADVDLGIVNALNQRKSYPVVIKGETEKTILVPNVRAVYAVDQKSVIDEISQATVLAVSVGKNALGKVIPVIAEGLILRYQLNPDLPLDIIIAENIRSADEFIFEKLSSKLPDNYPINKLVGLVETSIGKMVPIMTSADLIQDPLQVFAESYNDLILDKKGFKGEIPNVKGLSPKENIKAWVDRKAFIHNLGHATVAYIGAFYHPEFQFIYEVLKDKQIFALTRKVMIQSANILLQYYPNDFTWKDLELHIDDLLFRFQNKALKDTIFRVGQDLPRKLNIDDRFAAVIQIAKQKGLEYDLILEAMTFGFFFIKTNENGQLSEPDKLFQNALKSGLEDTLIKMCGFNPGKDKGLMDELNSEFQKLAAIKIQTTS